MRTFIDIDLTSFAATQPSLHRQPHQQLIDLIWIACTSGLRGRASK